MNVALCCICRLENNYLNEWVNHYLKLGFDKIFIYDNNDEDGERPESVLSDELSTGKIKIVDFRRYTKAQFSAYTNCYNTYKKDYDWIAFFDCDEFLMLENFTDIHDFLSQDKFNKCDSIVFNWKNYGDSDLTGNDKIKNYKLVDRFKTPAPFEKTETLFTKYNNFTYKKIVKTCYKEDIFVDHCHYINNKFSNFVNSLGEKVKIKDITNDDGKSSITTINYKEAWINHYATKTITEFMSFKYAQGDAISGKDSIKNEMMFWSINRKTPYKQRIVTRLKKNLPIDNLKEDETVDFKDVNKSSIKDLLNFALISQKRRKH